MTEEQGLVGRGNQRFEGIASAKALEWGVYLVFEKEEGSCGWSKVSREEQEGEAPCYC